MENLHRKSHSESLKTTLNCYQLSSADSLSGPSGYSAIAAQLWFKDNKQAPPHPPPPLIQIPLLMPNDTSTQRAETSLVGKPIACFIVGGEKRLCLPQILTTVLRDYSIAEINRMCAELHIYCSRCSPEQLELLKVLGILPFNTTQCGLITKTDAERLVSALGVDYQFNSKYHLLKKDSKGIQVYHECFGRGDGIIYPDLYMTADSPCIECMDCKTPLTPAKFVSHSHRGLEKHTCHWGFDPENWRHYMLLSKDTASYRREEYERILTSVKEKFEDTRGLPYTASSPPSKRKRDSDNDLPQPKKVKEEKREDPIFLPSSPRIPPLCYGLPLGIRPSAFKPWPCALPSSFTQLPAELRAAHEDALLKAMLPMIHDRHLLPAYFQFGSPSLLPTSEPTLADWSATCPASNVTPNLTLAPPKQRHKRHQSVTRSADGGIPQSVDDGMPGASRRPSSSSKSHVTQEKECKSEFSRNRSFDATTGEWHGRAEKQQQHQQHHPNNNNNNTKSPSSQSASSEKARSSSFQRAQRASGDRDISAPIIVETDDDSTGRDAGAARALPASTSLGSPKSKNLIEKTVTPLLAINKAVAAASAMLELSTAAKSSKTMSACDGPQPGSAVSSPPRSNSKQDEGKKPETEPRNPFFQVVPLSPAMEHFKWSFGASSYIISESGTQELQSIHSLLDSAGTVTSAKHQILHTLVKMKSRYEERLDIQARVKKDLETELEHIKSSKKQRLQEAAEVRKQVMLEMEKMRQEHNNKIKEMQDRSTQPNDSRTYKDDQDYNAKKEIEFLKKLIDDKDKANGLLRTDLVKEQDKRLLAEMRLDEILDGSRGRIPLLMQDGAFSSLPRRRNADDGPNGSKTHPQTLSASSRRNLETIVSSSASNVVSSSVAATKGSDVVIDITASECAEKSNEKVRHSSSKDSGIHDVA